MKADSFAGLSKLISERTGLRVEGRDGGALRKIVAARMSRHGFSSTEQYMRLLESDDGESRREREELIVLLTVGESYFFRDKGQFELLRSIILPRLVKRRKSERTLRVWSAGCAAGEEPYSLAMLIHETFSNLQDWRVMIVGTDIKKEFLEKARKGIYGAWSFRMAMEGMRERYFTERDGRFELDPRIKDMVTFRRGDLVNDVFPEPGGELRDMDLILCRNVFIYYDRKTVASIVEKMAGALKEGGYLITGHWELFSSPSGLRPRMFPESLAYERVKKDVPAEFKPYYPAPAAKDPAWPGPAAVLPRPVAPTDAKETAQTFISVDSAEELFKNGAYREAVQNLKAVLAIDPADFRSLILIASAHANLGEHDQAVDYLRRAIKMDRLSVEPYYLLAHIAEEKGDREEAVENLRKVIYLEPSAVAAYLELASIHENGGDGEKARRMRKAALDALKRLPEENVVAPYGKKAGELIRRVERLLE